MSSHREAPEISKDPVADSTDLYAFVSPDKPDTVTLIANYIPLQEPAGGPNFYEFGDDVLYEIHIDNTRRRRAPTSPTSSGSRPVLTNPDTLPVQHRADHVADRPELEQQAVLLGRAGRTGGGAAACSATACSARRATSARCPRRTTRPRSASRRCTRCRGGIKVFAGQRAERFYVDLGSIFDLANLRPFQNCNVFAHRSGWRSCPASTPPTT